MHYFYQDDIKALTSSFELNIEEAHHLKNVLRLGVGSSVIVMNGKGLIFDAVVTESNKKKVFLECLNHKIQDKAPYYLHLAIAPTKNMDRLSFLLEKATEIGVQEITFLSTKHTERCHLRMDRLEKVVISACKQSVNAYKPILNELITFDDFIKKIDSNTINCIAHCYESNKKTIDSLQQTDKYLICIGPEGDFSENEVATAIDLKFIPITLGNNRLRTETAGIVAVSQVAQMFI